MKDLEETTEGMIHFKLRTFVSLVAGLVIGTNTINSVLTNISANADQIEYNAEADKRRRANSEEKMELKTNILHLQDEKDRVQRELNICKDDK